MMSTINPIVDEIIELMCGCYVSRGFTRLELHPSWPLRGGEEVGVKWKARIYQSAEFIIESEALRDSVEGAISELRYDLIILLAEKFGFEKVHTIRMECMDRLYEPLRRI